MGQNSTARQPEETQSPHTRQICYLLFDNHLTVINCIPLTERPEGDDRLTFRVIPFRCRLHHVHNMRHLAGLCAAVLRHGQPCTAEDYVDVGHY